MTDMNARRWPAFVVLMAIVGLLGAPYAAVVHHQGAAIAHAHAATVAATVAETAHCPAPEPSCPSGMMCVDHCIKAFTGVLPQGSPVLFGALHHSPEQTAFWSVRFISPQPHPPRT
jgi:hypothetical protein